MKKRITVAIKGRFWVMSLNLTHDIEKGRYYAAYLAKFGISSASSVTQ
jgi:hypothetical protein